MTASPFSSHYPGARELFRAAATSAGAEVDSYPYPAKGPSGEELTTEVAWIGPREAKKVLVTVSGTHGIEGFAGSAAQVDWLQRGEWKKLQVEAKFTDSAAMLVHAINPYGFAWRRRVTHENIDLNRNWMDFSLRPQRRTDYDELADALCPTQWTVDAQKQTLQVLQTFIANHGMRRFVTAVSGGQHDHPKGLFYGGTSPSAARLTLTKILRRHPLPPRLAVTGSHTRPRCYLMRGSLRLQWSSARCRICSCSRRCARTIGCTRTAIQTDLKQRRSVSRSRTLSTSTMMCGEE